MSKYSKQLLEQRTKLLKEYAKERQRQQSSWVGRLVNLVAVP